MESDNRFQFYLEHYYILPKDIKDDIIHCQRSMCAYLKVHKLVSDVFDKQGDADPVEKQRILDELEEDLEEINAEQQYLLLRLRDTLDKFCNTMRNNGIEPIQTVVNTFISNTLVPLIDNVKYVVYPTNVQVRLTEEALIRKHFLLGSDENASDAEDENIDAKFLKADRNEDSDAADADFDSLGGDDDKFKKDAHFLNKKEATNAHNMPLKSSLAVVTVSDDDDENDVDIDIDDVENAIKKSDETQEAKGELMKKLKDEKNSNENISANEINCTNLTESRMNMRQVLKRARKTKQQPRVFDEEENLILSELEKKPTESIEQKYSREPPPLVPIRISKSQFTNAISFAASSSKKESNGGGSVSESNMKKALSLAEKKQLSSNQQSTTRQYKKRNQRSNSANDASPSNAGLNMNNESTSTSSDDSNLEQPQGYFWDNEPKDLRTRPADYGKEGFLSIFNLFTPIVLSQLQMRRSKRTRRTIHTTERADFHYGRLDKTQPPQTGIIKKKKTAKAEFLLSPKIKRLQSNPKNCNEKLVGSSNRYTYIPIERRARTPNFTNEKLLCKECRKANEPLFPCSICDYMFHQACHEDEGKPEPHIKCPSCLANEEMKASSEKIIQSSSPNYS